MRKILSLSVVAIALLPAAVSAEGTTTAHPYVAVPLELDVIFRGLLGMEVPDACVAPTGVDAAKTPNVNGVCDIVASAGDHLRIEVVDAQSPHVAFRLNFAHFDEGAVTGTVCAQPRVFVDVAEIDVPEGCNDVDLAFETGANRGTVFVTNG